jgi:hypothetical protein
LEWNREKPQQWETFSFSFVGDRAVNIKSYHGKYVSAEPHSRLFAGRDSPQEWERFEIVEKGDGRVSLLTFHRKFVSAPPDFTANAAGTQISNTEILTIE